MPLRLEFSWFEYQGHRYPHCRNIDVAASQEDNYVCCFLADDGGCGVEHLTNLMSETKNKCASVLNKVIAKDRLSTENWSAEISLETAKISSLHTDQGEGQSVATTTFMEILADWIAFLTLTKRHEKTVNTLAVKEY